MAMVTIQNQWLCLNLFNRLSFLVLSLEIGIVEVEIGLVWQWRSCQMPLVFSIMEFARQTFLLISCMILVSWALGND